ncbi:MAG TPA: DUF899 domain-containing protein [Gaiellaceae bacterium]|nr:DUF899 domain-containing protein [Gaiellaceae bacterium]
MPEVVMHDEWLAARRALLAEEKELTRARDELGRKRRELPWERVEKEYEFDGPEGRRTLAGLFGGHSQLAVYHFMFGPDDEDGCRSCSFWADSFDRNVVHLAARDISLVAISRAPLEKLEAYRERMGWSFPWYSSFGSDFNYDLGVSFPPGGGEYNYRPYAGEGEREGVSVFAKDERGVFHTYSTYARGIDLLNTAYNFVDLVPKGRDEEGRSPQYWVRRRDEYGI